MVDVSKELQVPCVVTEQYPEVRHSATSLDVLVHPNAYFLSRIMPNSGGCCGKLLVAGALCKIQRLTRTPHVAGHCLPDLRVVSRRLHAQLWGVSIPSCRIPWAYASPSLSIFNLALEQQVGRLHTKSTGHAHRLLSGRLQGYNARPVHTNTTMYHCLLYDQLNASG